jgi:hypothetical protein
MPRSTPREAIKSDAIGHSRFMRIEAHYHRSNTRRRHPRHLSAQARDRLTHGLWRCGGSHCRPLGVVVSCGKHLGAPFKPRQRGRRRTRRGPMDSIRSLPVYVVIPVLVILGATVVYVVAKLFARGVKSVSGRRESGRDRPPRAETEAAKSQIAYRRFGVRMFSRPLWPRLALSCEVLPKQRSFPTTRSPFCTLSRAQLPVRRSPSPRPRSHISSGVFHPAILSSPMCRERLDSLEGNLHGYSKWLKNSRLKWTGSNASSL